MAHRWPRSRDPDPDEMEVVGTAPTPLRDLFHIILRAPWPLVLLGMSGAVLLINLTFALAYLEVGGIENAAPGSLRDAFFFSVDTLGTIGYGSMYPRSTAAHALVTVESMTGMFVVALITGLIFAKFGRARGRIVFAEAAVISPFDGRPSLMFRLGHERDTPIVEATVRLIMYRTERTREGVRVYRMYDVPLVRERAPTLSRSWTVMHVIDEHSLLHAVTPEILARDEMEFLLTVIGMDEVSGQMLHGRQMYPPERVRWGYRHGDLISERADGGLRIDLGRFHQTQPTEPTSDFPYPRRPAEKEPATSA